MAQGYLYVLVNSSMPGLIKVGCTSRSPAERAAELSAATGVATPFVLAFEQSFADCEAAEHAIHVALSARGFRISPNREFFRCPPNDAVHAILDLAEKYAFGTVPRLADEAVNAEREYQAGTLIREGDAHAMGEDDRLQSLAEAMRCYRNAARLGSAEAEQRIGAVFLTLTPSRANRRRVLRHLKTSITLGGGDAWVDMAELFAREGHELNCAKAFGRFLTAMTQQAGVPIDAAGRDCRTRIVDAAKRYLGFCQAHGWRPAHIDTLRDYAQPVLAALEAELDATRHDRHLHQAAAANLRYVYEIFSPPPPQKAFRMSRIWWPRRGFAQA
jgi:hypothetical protein